MTQVDFYILPENNRTDRFALACRLTEKAWSAGHRVCINVDTGTDADNLNEQLWTFREHSFIPHDLEKNRLPGLTPVIICEQLEATDEHDVLINLAEKVPACFSQFERLLEPVDNHPPSRAASRERYRYYRDCGYPINNHEIRL